MDDLEVHLMWVMVRDTIQRDVDNALYWYEQPNAARQTWVLYRSWLTFLWAFGNFVPAEDDTYKPLNLVAL